MGKIVLTLFLLTCFTTYAQEPEPTILFSQAIGKNIRKYRANAKYAYIYKDEERAQFLFDSLIKHVVNGSFIDNFKVRKFPRKRITLYKFEKPIYLMTYATWCVPGIGEIPAFNDIAERFKDKIDFVVLFWGSKKKIRNIKKKYSGNIKVLYVDEKENKNDFAIRTMKHSLGFPTSFLINSEKMILDVRRNIFHHYQEGYAKSYNTNYKNFMSGVNVLVESQLDN